MKISASSPPAPTLLPAASPLPGSPPPPPHHLRSSSSVGRSLPPPPPDPAAKSATPSPLTTTLPPPSSGIPPTLLKGLNPSNSPFPPGPAGRLEQLKPPSLSDDLPEKMHNPIGCLCTFSPLSEFQTSPKRKLVQIHICCF